jgi:hypothetical protein
MSDAETDSYRDDDERHRARQEYYARAKAHHGDNWNRAMSDTHADKGSETTPSDAYPARTIDVWRPGDPRPGDTREKPSPPVNDNHREGENVNDELSDALDGYNHALLALADSKVDREHYAQARARIESLFDWLQEANEDAQDRIRLWRERCDGLQQERDGCTRCGGEDRVLLCRECRGEVAERDARWTDEEVREMLPDSMTCPNCNGRPDRTLNGICWTCNSTGLADADAILREAKQQREDTD